MFNIKESFIVILFELCISINFSASDVVNLFIFIFDIVKLFCNIISIIFPIDKYADGNIKTKDDVFISS